MTMQAKFPGHCPTCGQPIHPGDEIEWERGRKATHTQCPDAPSRTESLPADAIRISRGEGYGGQAMEPGQLLRYRPSRESENTIVVIVLSASQEYVREDGMTFGVGDEQGHIYSAICRPATEEEAAPLLAREQAAADRNTRRARRDEIIGTIRRVEHNVAEPVSDLSWLDIPHDRVYSTPVQHNCVAADPATGIWYSEYEYDFGRHYWCAPYDPEVAAELMALLV